MYVCMHCIVKKLSWMVISNAETIVHIALSAVIVVSSMIKCYKFVFFPIVLYFSLISV